MGSEGRDGRRTVFVYGTLRVGESNHHLLCDAHGVAYRVATTRTAPRYTLLDLGRYPALVEGGSTAVVGELYRVAPAALAALDLLEGHPDLYERRPVWLADGASAEAYLLPGGRAAGGIPLPGGDWVRRLRS